MQFKDLNLKINDQEKVIKINDQEVHIKKYLPISQKLDIIDIALQNAKQADVWYNELKLQVYFNLYLVYSYSDIEFTDEEKADPEALYDILESNHFFSSFIYNLEKSEYDFLLTYMKAVKNDRVIFNTSTAGIITTLVQDLPKNASAANQILEHFDPDKFKQVVEFAEAANGARPIPKMVQKV